jgi:hypothetical protein
MVTRTANWTVAICIASLTVLVLALNVVIPWTFMAIDVRHQAVWSYVPSSGHYRDATIRATGTSARDSDVVEEGTLSLTITTLGGVTKTISMDHHGDLAALARDFCGPDLLARWLAAQGIDASDERVQLEARELSTELLHAAAGYHGPSDSLVGLRPIR